MTKDDIYYDLFVNLRGMGLTKLFEEYSVRFFMGIASTQCAPADKHIIIESLKKTPPTELPDDYITFMDSILKDTDRIRYHPIYLPHMAIHYFIILNDDLIGRLEELPNVSSAFSKMRINTIPRDPNAMVETTDETVVAAPYYDVFGLMVIGNKSPEISDITRGSIIKHELTHILIKYLIDIDHPDLLDTYKDDITREELDSFIEFLCDFIQHDSSVVNKCTGNPINKFTDVMDVLFKPEKIEEYAPYLKTISKFYTM